MDNRQIGRHLGLVMLFVATQALGACSGTGSPNGDGGGGGSGNPGTLPAGSGICADTCEKDCTSDQDCDMSQVELCCDLAPAGKSCMAAGECPRQCTTDSQCDSTHGLACVRMTLAFSQKYCDSPAYGIQPCSANADCPAGNMCCGIYNQPFCLPASQCPHACSTSAECDTGSGEICCTSVRSREPNLNVSGLCLNPKYERCPETCTTSMDCTSQSAPLCCNGLCAATCAQICTQNSDCTRQICCKSAMMRISSQPTQIFTSAPTCTGAAYSCSSCAYPGGCKCPGCSWSSAGYCSGSNDASCALCGGTAASCVCSGCTWLDAESCTGTATPCGQLSADTCESNLGCHLSIDPYGH